MEPRLFVNSKKSIFILLGKFCDNFSGTLKTKYGRIDT